MKVTNKEKNILYAAASLIGLILLYLLVFKPIYVRHLDIKYQVENKKSLLNRYKAILMREDKLKERVTYIRKEFEQLDTLLLTGTKPSLAASELQALVEKLAKKANVKIKNFRNQKPNEKNDFYQIPIEMNIESSLRELKDIIFNIENSSKFLLVSDLSIRLTTPGNPEKLESKLTIEGFLKNNS